METATGIAGSLVGIGVLILAVILVVFWVFFPLLLISKVRKVVRELEKLNADQAARHGEIIEATNKVVVNTAIIADKLTPRPPVV